MSRYKYKIQKEENGYVFRLYPNNSNSQPIGVSGELFSNETEARRALQIFKDIINTSDVMQLLNYGKISDLKWCPFLESEGIVLMKREIPLKLGEYECRDWAMEIKNNYDAKILEVKNDFVK